MPVSIKEWGCWPYRGKAALQAMGQKNHKCSYAGGRELAFQATQRISSDKMKEKQQLKQQEEKQKSRVGGHQTKPSTQASGLWVSFKFGRCRKTAILYKNSKFLSLATYCQQMI